MHQIGIDIVEISRISKAITRWEGSFLHRVYTDAELKLCGKKHSSLAARFAGKEAVLKALKRTNGISWKQIEVLAEPDGSPRLCLHGRAREQAERLGLGNLAITLAHSKEYAIAMVSGETK